MKIFTLKLYNLMVQMWNSMWLDSLLMCKKYTVCILFISSRVSRTCRVNVMQTFGSSQWPLPWWEDEAVQATEAGGQTSAERSLQPWLVHPAHRSTCDDCLQTCFHVFNVYSANLFPSNVLHVNSDFQKTNTTSRECTKCFYWIRGHLSNVSVSIKLLMW